MARKVNELDIIGRVFGRLTVVSYLYHTDTFYYRCKCECGNETIVKRHSLLRGLTKSCGCLRREKSSERVKGIATKRFVTYNGKTMCVKDWAKELGLSPNGMSWRLCKYGEIDKTFQYAKKN